MPTVTDSWQLRVIVLADDQQVIVTDDPYHRFFTDAVEAITAWRSWSPVRRL